MTSDLKIGRIDLGPTEPRQASPVELRMTDAGLRPHGIAPTISAPAADPACEAAFAAWWTRQNDGDARDRVMALAAFRAGWQALAAQTTDHRYQAWLASLEG